MKDRERTAIGLTTNLDRLLAWARRYELATGRRPRLGCRWIPPHVKAEQVRRLRQEQHGNGNVIKMPQRHRQYVGAVPTGPEAA